jgi:hypothetical protein
MADEISIGSKLQLTRFGIQTGQYTTSDSVTMTGTNMVHQNQTVPTSVTLADTGTVDTTGYFWLKLKNLDATNYVTVQVKHAAAPSYTSVGILRAGESWGPVLMGPVSGALNDIYLLANTASCEVEITAVEV